VVLGGDVAFGVFLSISSRRVTLTRSVLFRHGRLDPLRNLFLVRRPDAAGAVSMSGGIERSDRDRVLESTDLVALVGEHVRLTRKGREHHGLCPFHDDHRPSMALVTHKGIPFFKCFSCGAAGNAIDFMMRYHRLEFPEALRQLAERAGIALSTRRPSDSAERDVRGSLLRANELAARAFRRFLEHPELGAASRSMLDRRGVPATQRESFALGAAPEGWDNLVNGLEAWIARQTRGEGDRQPLRMEDFADAGLVRRNSRGGWIDGFRNRAVFPIRSEMGRVIAFGARQIDPEDQPKYLNSPESAVFDKSSTLYGLDLAKQSIIRRREAVVVEGYLDVIACHAAGFDQVVATLGTALTPDHARLLRHKAERVVLLFDGDEAGQRAADRAIEVFFGGSLDVRIGILPGGLDPDDLLKQDGGRDALQTSIDTAVDALAFMLKRFRAGFSAASGVSGRQSAIESFLRRLAELGFARMPTVRRSLVLDQLSQLTGLSLGDLQKAMPTVRPRSTQTDDPAESRVEVAAPEAGSAPVHPAARHAERTLVSVLLAWPELLDEEIAAADRPFRDPLAAAAAAWLLDCRDRGGEPALSDLLVAVEPSLRAALDELLALAERRPSLEGDAAGQLAAALADLERLERLEALDADVRSAEPATDPEDVHRRLERLRAVGVRPTAIGRISRTA
jgi:DNA primase